MSGRCLAALILTSASYSLVLGQQPVRHTGDFLSATHQGAFDAVVRGQSPEAIPADYRRNAELMEVAEYRNLLEEFEKTQAELNRLQRNLADDNIEDHGDHFHFASYRRMQQTTDILYDYW